MEKFYIGTDIGTNSVGIACTDENYNLLRAKGKDCWTVRLFDESKTATERRTKRTARRRLLRRRQRINFLQELFAPYIDDDTFFIRLNNSQFLPEDKDARLFGDKNTLFSGEYDDKIFHKDNPTVYHLRKRLIDGGNYDLRLYYLALHHIMKYRGHFLYEGNAEENDLKTLVGRLNDTLKKYGEDGDAVSFDETLCDEWKKILLGKNDKDKQKETEKRFGIKDKRQQEIIKGIVGSTINPSVLFGENYKDEKKFSFKEVTEEAFDAMQSVYGDDFDLLFAIRSIYNFVAFQKILGDKNYISEAMIDVYEKHKKDLELLKDFVKENAPRDKAKIFRNIVKISGDGKDGKEKNNAPNYVSYIGSTVIKGEKQSVKKCKRQDFLDYLKKYLKGLNGVKDEKTRDEILAEIEDDTFLPKISNSDNGLFPMQVNKKELEKIVENMVKDHPETQAFADKILPLFTFRIPYYVGPLTGSRSWAVKKTNEKITPWNFNEIIDKEKSNEEFMRRMTNKCTYLYGEDVLPKCSITYQKYDVLNQLNKLKINGVPISVDVKQKIYNRLFKKYKKVTDKAIVNLLINENYISEQEAKNVTLSGKDGDFKASMSSYISLKKILGEEFMSNNEEICEDIILWHTLHTDKNNVVNLIEKRYGDIPEIREHIKDLKGLSFKEFGRLSKKFLRGIRSVDKTTGETVTVTDVLYDTNKNLNEILYDERYNFGEVIAEENNGQASDKTGYDAVDELYVSPAVKRGIWQTLTVIDEYVNAIGRTPDKIFVEVTREDDKKGDEGRKSSRKKQLLEKYKNVKEGYADVIEKLGKDEYTDLKLRQLGRCMYSGERIELDKLTDSRFYDVDHILPRTFIKDDSLDNKVLVRRELNEKKKDEYPVPSSIVSEKARKHWELLLKKELISKNTYDKLTRTEPLTDDEYQRFIARQKVITDQTAKAVIELLKRKYPDTKIHFVKAKDVSDFKNDFKLFKCRETNDLHHARDAYLNVVVGNVYYTTFNTPFGKYYKDGDKWREYNLKHLFDRNRKDAWEQDGNESIKIVESVFAKHTMSVTKYPTCNKGEFYNETVYKNTDDSITAPRKEKGPLSDFTKYGGYKSQTTAYFAIILSDGKKGERIKTIEAIPVLTSLRAEKDPQAVEKHLSTYLKNPVIVIPKIKNKQLVSYNGTLLYLAGITGKQITVHNANQLYTDNKQDEYVRELGKLTNRVEKKIDSPDQPEYPMKTNKDGVKKLVITKEENEKLYTFLKNKLDEKIYKGLQTFETFKNNLEKGEETFKSLSVYEQSKVLLQILRFFKCNAEKVDLSLIGGSKNASSLLLNKNITNADFKIINLSPAGLTKKIRKV